MTHARHLIGFMGRNALINPVSICYQQLPDFLLQTINVTKFIDALTDDHDTAAALDEVVQAVWAPQD